jgi:hypothetical protein
MPTIDAESEHLETHVALCGERYRQLELRIARLEKVTWWAAGVSITGMGGVIVTLLSRVS